MKKLIVVRHGDYDLETLELNKMGREQIRDAANEIKAVIMGEGDKIDSSKILILTSPADRNILSAYIIAETFDTAVKVADILFVTKKQDYVKDNFLGLVESKKDRYDYLIIVSHGPVAKYFPHDFGEAVLKKEIPIADVKMGGFVVVDCA
ncbi:MAG: histidine phosphatase family protein [Minisyncoccia bacterium]|jgi:phosphohistidine phosphatase SixA